MLAIRTVGLRANHFPVKFNPNTIIMQDGVDVKPAVPPRNGRPVRISKSVLSVIRNKLSSDDPAEFPSSRTVYDGVKNIFSVVPLPTEKIDVEVHEGEDMKGGSYVVTINLVNELKFGKLKDYLNGQLLSIPRDVLHGMDVVMKENPSRHMITFGRSFFPREPREGDDLGWGITASRGFQHSLKSTSQGLALCGNYSVLAFQKKMSVLDFLWEHIPNFNIDHFRRFRRDVKDALGGLKVNFTHWNNRQKYIIRGLTRENTREVSFIKEDPECQNPPRQVRIVDYFREKYPWKYPCTYYGKDIMYKDIPFLNLGKASNQKAVPMEFCVLVEGQRYPKGRLDGNAGMAQNFGMEVNTSMTRVRGRVLGPPELKLGAQNGKVIKITVDKEKCQWNLVGKSVVEGKRIDRWGVIDFSSNDYKSSLNPDFFIPKLINRCINLGIHMEEPLIYKCTSMNKHSRVDVLLELLESVNEELNIVLPDHIVVFRDGVGDSQFEMVLNEELLDLKMALQNSPAITFIVAQKRHRTRLFLENERDGGPTGNASPGTVVDTTIVHPFEFDFYLFSHYGRLGTSKPTHYYVLWDEHGFTSDELQKLIYHMCFIFVRCTKPVSLVPPVYYADLIAYRGRLYYEAVVEVQSPASATSSSSSSSPFSAASLDPYFFKLHADLENIMFFLSKLASSAALECSILKSSSRYSSQVISQHVEAIDLYSTSAEDLDTVFCFLDLQDIKVSPRKMQYPVKDLLVSGHPTQFASQNAFN
uniref:Uncharacterized protein n=1 Tax=Quercus lobata TaxID=97700 RepID=A0A7N2R7Z6_QUELO